MIGIGTTSGQLQLCGTSISGKVLVWEHFRKCMEVGVVHVCLTLNKKRHVQMLGLYKYVRVQTLS